MLEVENRQTVLLPYMKCRRMWLAHCTSSGEHTLSIACVIPELEMRLACVWRVSEFGETSARCCHLPGCSLLLSSPDIPINWIHVSISRGMLGLSVKAPADVRVGLCLLVLRSSSYYGHPERYAHMPCGAYTTSTRLTCTTVHAWYCTVLYTSMDTPYISLKHLSNRSAIFLHRVLLY